jgi:hypothetical protein
MRGYDEIAHVTRQSECLESNVLEEILSYPNIIMTSRHNVLFPRIMDKFDRKVENMGLDQKTGVDEYLKAYFRQDSVNIEAAGNLASLTEFLLNKPEVKHMCVIPLHTAMLCMIWTPQVATKFQGTLRVTDLYSEVVFWLGKKYLEKFYSKNPQGVFEEEVMSLPEIEFLKSISYDWFQGISSKTPLNSSVDHSSTRDQVRIDKDMVRSGVVAQLDSGSKFARDTGLIENVFKLHLLTPVDKETTKLTDEDCQFIHSTFREYMFALALQEKLMTNPAQTAQLIGEHRADPHYMLPLKFLSGLISKEHVVNRPVLATRFWEVNYLTIVTLYVVN